MAKGTGAPLPRLPHVAASSGFGRVYPFHALRHYAESRIMPSNPAAPRLTASRANCRARRAVEVGIIRPVHERLSSSGGRFQQ